MRVPYVNIGPLRAPCGLVGMEHLSAAVQSSPSSPVLPTNSVRVSVFISQLTWLGGASGADISKAYLRPGGNLNSDFQVDSLTLGF